MRSNAARTACVSLLLLNLGIHSLAQGTFQNLSFESPILPLVPDLDYEVPISAALPGWVAYIDGYQIDRVGYNAISLGAPWISLHGPGSLEPVLHGQYRVCLQPDFVYQHVAVAIAQTGSVPLDALSVRFYLAKGSPVVSFSGQQLPTTLVGVGPEGWKLYAADVSQSAGLTGELRFGGAGILDNIYFSSSPVPEPIPAALFGVGLGVLACAGRRRKV